MPTTFKDEWNRIRKTGDIAHSPLFASSYVPSKSRTQHRQLTSQQKSHQRAVYHPTPTPVWSEYAGHSSHRINGYSAIEMERISKHAQQVFRKAEYVLSSLIEKW